MPTDVELEEAPCPLGCPGEGSRVTTGRDRELSLPGEYRVVRCQGCGLLRTNPRPTLATMGYYYPAAYAPYDLARATPTSLRRTRRQRLARRLVTYHDHALPEMKPGRLLELGCASGQFLRTMVDAGWEARGIEPSPEAARLARVRGLEVVTSQVELAPEPDGSFDLITAWMVLEHLHDPRAVLTRLRRWIRPSGLLAFSVPNAASLERRAFGPNWYALQLPRHLYHFSPETLTALLAITGWRVDRVMHQRVLTNLVGSAALALEGTRCRNIGRRLSAVSHSPRFNKAAYPVATTLAAIGQTGRMTVWARPDS